MTAAMSRTASPSSATACQEVPAGASSRASRKRTAASWGRFLPEHTTAVSLLDRLLHHANVVVTDGESFRMRQARARGGNTLHNK